MKMEVRYAKIVAETRPSVGPNGEDAEFKCEIEGAVNDLLNAFSQLTRQFVRQLADHLGSEELAMSLYSQTQLLALRELGVADEDEEGAVE